MKTVIKKLLKKLSPKKNHLQFDGPYETWEEAKKKSVGYSSNVVITKVESAIKNVLNGKFLYERDGVNFDDFPKQNTLINKLKDLELEEKTILDIGGGLGSLYVNYENIFQNLKQYLVLEQEQFCSVGNRIANEYDLKISYHENIQTVPNFNISIISSSLQYFEDWNGMVNKIISKSPDHIFIDRHPLTDEDTKIFIQLNTNFYSEQVTYPLHIINKSEFINSFINYKVIDTWSSDFDPDYFKGFHLVKNDT